MASERLEGSGSMGDDWAPSPELLEERELLSGLLGGLSDLVAGAPVEEVAVVPDPGAEGPPAVVVPPAEVSASAVAAQAPTSVLASLAADSSAEALAASPAAPNVSVPVVAAVSSIGVPAGGESAPASSPGAPIAPAIVGTAERASNPALTAGSSHAPALTTEMPATLGHSTAPGAEAVDSLLAKVADASESHGDSTVVDSAKAPAVEPGTVVKGPTARHAADSKAADAHAAAEGEARVGADVAAARANGPAAAPEGHAVNAPAAGSVSAHGAGMAEGRVDGRVSTDREYEFSPADEEAAQPHMMAEVSSGERTAETVGPDMPTLEDNQPEEAEAPIERSLVQPDGDHTASDPSGVGAKHETTKALQGGEVRIVEPAEAEEELVSRISQLFDLVPNWPGVDLDALEGAARSQVEDGAQFGADLVDGVSTHDVSCWVTATASTAIGFGIARRELGLQIRDTADGGPA